MPYKRDCTDNKGPSAWSIESNEGKDWCPFIRYDVHWELLRGVCIKINCYGIATVRHGRARERYILVKMTSYREAIVFRLFSAPFLFSPFSLSLSLSLSLLFFFPFFSSEPHARGYRGGGGRGRDRRYKSCTNFAWRSVMLFARAPLVRVSCSWAKRFNRSLWVLESQHQLQK